MVAKDFSEVGQELFYSIDSTAVNNKETHSL